MQDEGSGTAHTCWHAPVLQVDRAGLLPDGPRHLRVPSRCCAVPAALAAATAAALAALASLTSCAPHLRPSPQCHVLLPQRPQQVRGTASRCCRCRCCSAAAAPVVSNPYIQHHPLSPPQVLPAAHCSSQLQHSQPGLPKQRRVAGAVQELADPADGGALLQQDEVSARPLRLQLQQWQACINKASCVQGQPRAASQAGRLAG